MKRFRKIIFWIHLVLGLTAGGVIAVVAVTGALMVFQPQILAWDERGASHVTPSSANASPLPVETLLKRVHQVQPEARIQNVTLSSDPIAAVVLSVSEAWF